MREATLQTSSGREVHVQASTSRMRAVGGTVLGAVVTLEDVSDIKALTAQLIRADRLAAMGELTAGVAHEVRNPLGVIRASVQLLDDAQVDHARIHEAAEVIKQEIDRLDRVIKALLDFGRPSKPTLVRTDINSVLEDVVLFTNRFAKQHGVHIEERFEDELPDVFGDPDQLKQVFLNLVTNAVQAIGESEGLIVIETRPEGEYVEVTVADDGPGISSRRPAEGVRPLLHEAGRGHRTRADHRASHHRRARGAYRSGEQFGRDDLQGHASRSDGRVKGIRMSKRVLIVDDEKNMRWVLGQSLSGDGFEVAEAADGKEALAAVAEQEPDIMVLDHRMPVMDGMEVLRTLRSKGSTFPIIMLTAHGNVALAVEAMKAGANEYLTKPFDLEELKLAIDKALQVLGARRGGRAAAQANSTRSTTSTASSRRIPGCSTCSARFRRSRRPWRR